MDKNILEKNAISALRRCKSYIKYNQTEKAISEAQTIIEKCKIIINTERDTHCYDISDKALVLGIFFRGIQNFATLKQMTVSSDWIKNPPLIEQVWTEMWDCKDRLEYISSYIKTKNLQWIFNDVDLLYQTFDRVFGHGLYVSSCFLAERHKCNICGQDMRACEHIQGMIYLGKVCEGILEGISGAQNLRINHPYEITGNHVLLTEHPKDPRCRIWPWKIEKKINKDEVTTLEVIAFHFFKLADFI
jgi:cell fate (sporulation/competence/biofilm development) regulator YmcA (YheA/YmcA/DUF963 family)